MYGIILFILALMPSLAQAANLFEPVPADKAMHLLAAMFGQLGVFGASSSDAFSGVITTFNAAALTVGGILVAYTIFAGTMGTAHDGEMLGKKFSSVWVPIRTAVGTALVLPVMTGGYCVMQALVGWLIVQGIGLADNVWSSYMSASNITKIVTVGMEKPAVSSLAWNTFGSLACMRGYEKLYNDSITKSGGMWPAITWGTTTSSTPGGTLIEFGAKTEVMGFFKNSCGSITIDRQEPLPTGNPMNEFSLMGDLSALNGDLSAADAKHVGAVNSLIAAVDNTAKSFIGNTGFDVSSEIKVASATYETATKNAAAGVVAKLGDFTQLEKSASKDGFLLAGAWFMRLSYLSEVAQKAVAKVPTASGSSGSVNNNFKDQFQSSFLKPLVELRGKSDAEFGISNSEDQSKAATDGGAGVWDWIKSGFSLDKLVKKVFKADAMAAASSDEHPVMAMKRVGNWAGIVGGAMFLKYGAALTAVGNLQGAGTSLAIATLPIAMIVFPALMAISFMLSFVLPMLPFLIWIGVCLGWVVLCVEALIAAPMWAVMHLTAHGDDMTGSGSQGYRLVLSLTLRPALMVFGLIGALTIITVFGQMINMVFFDVFILSQQDSSIFIWIAGLLAAPLIYAGVMWTVIKKSMEAVHIIPDQILTWFGGAGQQLGHYGESLGGQGSQSYAAVAAVGGMAGGALSARRQGVDLQQQIGQKQAALAGNAQAKEAAISGIKSDLDEKLGGGGSSIVQKAMSEGGKSADFNSLEAQQIGSKMDGGIQALGGKESSAGVKFNESMNADMDQGMHFDQAFSKNLKAGMDEQYGSGAGAFLDKASQGKLQGSEFTKGVEQLNEISGHYASKGLSGADVSEKTSKVLSAADKNYTNSTKSTVNGGENNINHYVDKAIGFAKKSTMKDSK
jgi:conjugal transfer/type IV secretion protein DotA/TraY